MKNFIYSVFQILLQISPFEQLYKLAEDAAEPALSRRLDEMVCSNLNYSMVFKHR